MSAGQDLDRRIVESVADTAGAAFGSWLKAEVLTRVSAGLALASLIAAIPSGVPVAVLVDEYDAAIIKDVDMGRWEAAQLGIHALGSLMLSAKTSPCEARISRFLVTGVARFAHTSLLSTANNFVDLSAAPITSRVLGFSEDEILASFPEELARLGQGLSENDVNDTLKLQPKGNVLPSKPAERAMAVLRHWYSGYCFDGTTPCFNPFPVLTALSKGALTGVLEMEGAANTAWLGLAPLHVLNELSGALTAKEASFDIADLHRRRVDSAAMLLQTGLLTPARGQYGSISTSAAMRMHLVAPNEYARRTFVRVVEKGAWLQDGMLGDVPARMCNALLARDATAFTSALDQALSHIVRSTVAHAPKGKDGSAQYELEAPYHAFLHGLLLALPAALGTVTSEPASGAGNADLVVHLHGMPSFPAAVWILEVGGWAKKDKKGSPEVVLRDKLEQGKTYALPFASVHVKVCAIVVNTDTAKYSFAWAQCDAGSSKWEDLDNLPLAGSGVAARAAKAPAQRQVV